MVQHKKPLAEPKRSQSVTRCRGVRLVVAVYGPALDGFAPNPAVTGTVTEQGLVLLCS